MQEMKDATSVERMLFDKASRMQTPIYCTMELLPLCNMNCEMCFIRLTPEELARKGRLRTADEWIEMAQQMKDAGVLFVSLTGGEPLLFPEFKRLYLALRQMGMIVTINTNGTLIDEMWAAFFGENKPRRINITLYGVGEQAYREVCHYPGGFERVQNAVRLLRMQGVDVKINGSIVRQNAQDGPEIVRIARDLGAAASVETYMFPATRERDKPYNLQARLSPEDAARARVAIWQAEMEPEAFYKHALGMLFAASHTPPGEETPGRMQCAAGSCACTVSWQGEMRPCVMLSPISVPVFETGFDAAWKRITELTGSVRIAPKCSKCTLRAVCSPCAARALHETGSYDGVGEYICRYTAGTLQALSDAWNAVRMKAEKADDM